MDVFSIVTASIGLAETAITCGLSIYKFAHAYPLAAKQIFSATEELDIQRYTLDTWLTVWDGKAEAALDQNQSVDDQDPDAGFVLLWGSVGYQKICSGLRELETQFRETERKFQSIDPEGFASRAGRSSLQPPRRPTSTGSRPTSPSSFWHRLWRPSPGSSNATSSGGGQGSRKRHRRGGSSTSATAATGDRIRAVKKVKWCSGLREELRHSIESIREWIRTLHHLAKLCETKQRMGPRRRRQRTSVTTPLPADWTVQQAAKALHRSLTKFPTRLPGPVDIALIRDRARTAGFQRLLPSGTQLGSEIESFKFPILLPVDSPRNRQSGVIALAEIFDKSLRPSTQRQLGLERSTLREDATLGEVVAQLTESRAVDRYRRDGRLAEKLVLREDDSLIALHPISHIFTPLTTLKELPQLLQGTTQSRGLASYQNRLTMACTVATTVLQLHDSELLPYALASTDIIAHARPISADLVRGINEPGPEQLFVGFTGKRSTTDETAPQAAPTPFDIILQSTSQALITEQARTALCFHRLGIILFEVGRGKTYSDVFDNSSTVGSASDQGQVYRPYSRTASKVYHEIDKICLGQPYRELVKLCLTGSLYVAVAGDVAGAFNRMVVERLRSLERSMEAIVRGGLVS